MGVALASGQDAEHQGAQHVAHRRCVGAAVAQRAAVHPSVKDACRGQELGEVHDLAMRRGLGRFVPAHVHAPAHRLHRHKLITGLRDSRLLALDQFTHGVRVANPRQPAPVLGFSPNRRNSTGQALATPEADAFWQTLPARIDECDRLINQLCDVRQDSDEDRAALLEQRKRVAPEQLAADVRYLREQLAKEQTTHLKDTKE